MLYKLALEYLFQSYDGDSKESARNFRRLWRSAFPKNQIITEKKGKKIQLVVCFIEFRNFNIISAIHVGPRGGLRSSLVIYDKEKIMSEAITCIYPDSSELIDIFELKYWIKRKKLDFNQAIIDRVKNVLESSKETPNEFAMRLKHAPYTDVCHWSSNALVGGLTGAGKG